MHLAQLHPLMAISRTAVYLLITAIAPRASFGAPYVEFDFARAVECRDITPVERLGHYPQQRLVELRLPVSVRFRGVEPADVEELTMEISGVAAGLRVYDFAPATQLASDVAKEIETITTSKSGRSIDATLGGALPVPFAAKVANVTPSVSAGASNGETTTEKLNRLPPKHALVVSGTSLEGRGVFFKLKRSSQTSLEGVHELAVMFIAPAGWRGGEVQVGCSARGQRKLLWMTQSAILGREGDTVRLYMPGRTVREVAKPIIVDGASPVRQVSHTEAAAVTAAKSSESESSPPPLGSNEAASPHE